jgi:hypothetical protein
MWPSSSPVWLLKMDLKPGDRFKVEYQVISNKGGDGALRLRYVSGDPQDTAVLNSHSMFKHVVDIVRAPIVPTAGQVWDYNHSSDNPKRAIIFADEKTVLSEDPKGIRMSYGLKEWHKYHSYKG